MDQLTKKEINTLTLDAIKEHTRSGQSDKLDQICNKILNGATIDGIVKFVMSATRAGVKLNTKPFSIRVADEGDAKQNFEFATIDGVDSKIHRDKIIQTENIEINMLAGKQIKDKYLEEYVNKHGEIVLNGTAYQNFNYLFRNKSRALNKQSHFDRIIETKDLFINKKCAKEIDGADVLAHGQVIIDSRIPLENLMFAKIKGADIEAHLEIVLQLGDARHNFMALQEFEQCNLLAHINKIFASPNETESNEVKIECIKWLKSQNLYNQYKTLPCIQQFAKDYKAKLVVLENGLRL